MCLHGEKWNSNKWMDMLGTELTMIHAIKETVRSNVSVLCRHGGMGTPPAPQLDNHTLPSPRAGKKTQKGIEGGKHSLCFYHSTLEAIQLGRVAEK